jgi:hypothetical protein
MPDFLKSTSQILAKSYLIIPNLRAFPEAEVSRY